MGIEEYKLSDFFNNEYKNYAIYTIENRAIASCIDGMKPIHRKIFYTALNNVKVISNKVSTLAGKVISEAAYHNGNISCEEAIVLMAQDFKNNIPYFKGIGQFGSLKNPFASSSRYISVKLSDNILNVFKDEYLLEHNVDDFVIIEPKFYLPIIPMILINGSSGIALGYNTKILNRNPLDIINACIQVLNGEKITKKIDPKITGFFGDISKCEESNKRWIFTGTYKKTPGIIHITEIPPSMTYEKYESLLEELIDAKEIISYDNLSSEKISYVVKISKDKILSNDDIIKLFKLQETHFEIYTTLDEHGKLKIFETTEQIVNYFVEFRLRYYHKRKEFILNRMQYELNILSNRGRFIKAILDDKLELKNKQKTEIIKDIETIGLAPIDDSYDYLLRMPLYSLTKELFDKLREDFRIKKEDIGKLKATDPKDMYNEDLSELKKKIV